MKNERESQFEQNYSATTCASALIFSVFFIGFVFLLNITYVKQSFINEGFIGLFVLFSYFIFTSIVLFPILCISNSILGILIKKIMKPIYLHAHLIGFIVFPAIMSLIPFSMLLLLKNVSINIHQFDFYFIFYATWISAIIQYIWLLKSIKEDRNQLNFKQIQYLKHADGIDYF